MKRHSSVRVNLVRVDPFAPRILIDYDYFCRRFGPLPFGDFVMLWHVADAFTQAAIDDGYEPHEVPELLITDQPRRMDFIRSTIQFTPSTTANIRPAVASTCSCRRAACRHHANAPN